MLQLLPVPGSEQTYAFTQWQPMIASAQVAAMNKIVHLHACICVCTASSKLFHTYNALADLLLRYIRKLFRKAASCKPDVGYLTSSNFIRHVGTDTFQLRCCTGCKALSSCQTAHRLEYPWACKKPSPTLTQTHYELCHSTHFYHPPSIASCGSVRLLWACQMRSMKRFSRA